MIGLPEGKRQLLKKMVSRAGLEPATTALKVQNPVYCVHLPSPVAVI